MDSNFRGITEATILEIAMLVKSHYGYDFTEYSRASFTRRVIRFMEMNDYKSGFDLKYNLVNFPAVFNNFLENITVNVTEMFRDPYFFENIKTHVLPTLASYPVIRIWHAGCSTGEEAYSMCILLREAGLLHRSYIYATDINPNNIQKAKRGEIAPANFADAIKNYKLSGGDSQLIDYFTITEQHVTLDKALLNKIIFSRHNLVTESSFNEFNLILCRNVLIYFNRELQNNVLRLFNESLPIGGFLGLGSKENLATSNYKDNFQRIGVDQKIYKKISNKDHHI